IKHSERVAFGHNIFCSSVTHQTNTNVANSQGVLLHLLSPLVAKSGKIRPELDTLCRITIEAARSNNIAGSDFTPVDGGRGAEGWQFLHVPFDAADHERTGAAPLSGVTWNATLRDEFDRRG